MSKKTNTKIRSPLKLCLRSPPPRSNPNHELSKMQFINHDDKLLKIFVDSIVESHFIRAYVVMNQFFIIRCHTYLIEIIPQPTLSRQTKIFSSINRTITILSIWILYRQMIFFRYLVKLLKISSFAFLNMQIFTLKYTGCLFGPVLCQQILQAEYVKICVNPG